jgi:hypothetical protein
MPERIVTDSNGDRWDVRQPAEGGALSFRHQSGREYTASEDVRLGELSAEALLARIDDALVEAGEEPVSRGGVERSLDPEGYVTE